MTALWFGLLGGAVAWALHLVVAYVLVGLGCSVGLPGPLDPGGGGLTLLLVLLTAAAGLAAALAWLASYRTYRAAADGDRDATLERKRFMGLAGILMNPLFLLGILLHGISRAFLDLCQ